MIVLLERQQSTPVSSWTEYLCLASEGMLEVSVRSRTPLYLDGWWFGPVVWPEGTEGDDDELLDEGIEPLTIGGERVAGWDGDALVGERLEYGDGRAPMSVTADNLVSARAWLIADGWGKNPGFETAWSRIERDALAAR